MKVFFIFLISLYEISISHAQENAARQPLIVKLSHPGFVMEEYSFSEICRLFKDRVELEYRLSNQVVKETRRLLGASQIEILIKKAKKEKLSENPNMICDAPTTTIFALEQASNTAEQVLLYSTGGCGSPKKIREGGAAFLLSTLIGKYCVTTH